MDTSYPVTPYPLSPYGGEPQQPPAPSHQAGSGRPMVAYLITPPTPTVTAPPSQAVTLTGEPIVPILQQPDGLDYRQQPIQQIPNLQSGNSNIGSIPQQPIISPPPAKYQNSSYEPMSPMPSFHERPASPPYHHQPSRLRPASDMPVFPSTVYYHHQPPQPVGMSHQHHPEHGYEEDICAAPNPTASEKKHGFGANLEGALRTHSQVSRILLPYWMLLCLGFLVGVLVLLGRVSASCAQMAGAQASPVVVEPKIVMPAVPHDHPLPVQQQPMQPQQHIQQQQQPVLQQQQQPQGFVRPRAPLHVAPLAPAHH